MQWLLVAWPTLIILGIGLRMSLTLTYGARGPEPGDPVHTFLHITSWVLIALGLAPAIIGGTISIFGNIIVLLAVSAVIEAVVQRRAAQRRSMCRVLCLLMERGSQLEPAVLTAGQSMSGAVRRSAMQLFDALNRGMPLGAAVARFPTALPAEAASYLAAGTSKTARLAALRELSRNEHSELAAIWRTSIDRISYLSAVLLFMTAAFTFIMLKIVPEYAQIFWEFDLELPLVTRAAIGFSEFVSSYLLAPLLFCLFALMLAIVVVCFCYLIDVPALKWLTDRFSRGQHTADVLRILAIATENREPFNDVLYRLASTYPATWISERLACTADLADSGTVWHDALYRTGIINKAEQNLVQTAEKVGNLPWALRQIASRREKIAVYRLASRLQVIYPLIIILLGGFVGFYAISLFIPIVELIEGLTS